jgi:hypothetical protein
MLNFLERFKMFHVTFYNFRFANIAAKIAVKPLECQISLR